MPTTGTQIFFKLSNTGLRSHEFKLCKPNIKLDIGKVFFNIRVVDMWNSVPELIIQCTTADKFKQKTDYYLKYQGYFN